MNILTSDEVAKRHCQLTCPPRPGRLIDGEVVKCPHGKWFVFRATAMREANGQVTAVSGNWHRAGIIERYRINKMMEKTDD